MLVLTRRENESILIGKDIVVTILGIRGSRIQIGVEAPNSVRILRHEVLQKIEAEASELQLEEAGLVI